jgi:predicted cupin superfamily sugar epimerase
VRADDEARAWVDALGLLPHPEGGLYRETYRSPLVLNAPQGERAASTAVYYLLAAGSFSAWHRVRSDEVWHHYAGDPLELHVIDSRGNHQRIELGSVRSTGQRPQHVVPAGSLQAAMPLGKRFTLCGCTVAPGFDFADFEMPSRAELLAAFPALSGIIERLTRPT